MGRKFIWIFSLFITSQCFVSCGSNDDDAPVKESLEQTVSGSKNIVLQGYESASSGFNVLKLDGVDNTLYIKDHALAGNAYQFFDTLSDDLKEVYEKGYANAKWEASVPLLMGHCYWAKTGTLTQLVYVCIRVAYIQGNNVGIEYLTLSDARENANANSAETYPTAGYFEMPALRTENSYLPHFVTYQNKEVLNMAIEWNASMKHAQWVAFEFNSLTGFDNEVGRADAYDKYVWKADPLLAKDLQTDNSFHLSDGFDRGHLCSSEDRQYSKEANEQTFYFSNMSPQLNAFNAGFWQKLEQQVQKWGYSVSKNELDNVYVVKGGTLNNLLKNFEDKTKGSDGCIPTTDDKGFTVRGLACPAYYYMAVVAEKNGDYQAIAFLVPHDGTLPKNASADDFKKYVVSIDQLEAETGEDFFCNLPDDLENDIESHVDVNLWAW